MEKRDAPIYTIQRGGAIPRDDTPSVAEHQNQTNLLYTGPTQTGPTQTGLPRSRNSNYHTRQGRHEIRALVYMVRNRQFRFR